jgi:hypothetical protein
VTVGEPCDGNRLVLVDGIVGFAIAENEQVRTTYVANALIEMPSSFRSAVSAGGYGLRFLNRPLLAHLPLPPTGTQALASTTASCLPFCFKLDAQRFELDLVLFQRTHVHLATSAQS